VLIETGYPAEGKEELEINVLCSTPVGDNVRQAGSDATKGTKVLDSGVVIGSGGGEVGLLGFVGKREVSHSQ
jgi:gephyrin